MVYKTTLLRYQLAYIKEVKNILDIYQITIFQCSKYSNLPTYWLVWSIYKTSTNGGHRNPWQLFRGHNSLANHLWPPPPPYCIWGLFVTRKLYFIYNISIYKQTRFIHFWPPTPPPPLQALESMLDPPNGTVFYVHCGLGAYKMVFTNMKYWEYYPQGPGRGQGPTGHDKICEKKCNNIGPTSTPSHD